MNKNNMIGVTVCAIIFLGSFWFVGGMAAYLNMTAFLVVFSGLFAALLLSYPYEKIKDAFRVARNSYAGQQASPEEIVNTLLDLAVQSRVDGVLSLEQIREKTTISFLKNGLMYLVDNYKESEIRELLSSEMAFLSLRRQQSERIFQTMAKAAPAFGVAGSVIGLIGLLMGINDTAVILQSIPVAFISTLYGVVVSNMILSPVAENIHFNTRTELLNQKLILEGIVAIKSEQNPYKLERRLTSFLSPRERDGKVEVLRDITRRYIDRRNEADKVDMPAAERKVRKQSARQVGRHGREHVAKAS